MFLWQRVWSVWQGGQIWVLQLQQGKSEWEVWRFLEELSLPNLHLPELLETDQLDCDGLRQLLPPNSDMLLRLLIKFLNLQLYSGAHKIQLQCKIASLLPAPCSLLPALRIYDSVFYSSKGNKSDTPPGAQFRNFKLKFSFYEVFYYKII